MKLLVVNYHYIGETKPEKGIYPVGPTYFVKQTETLSETYQFIDENFLLNCLKSKNFFNKKCCLLTVNDGLKEQMTAYEVMKKRKIKATFFISTLPLEKQKALDVHKMHYVRSLIPDEKILDEIKRKFPDKKIDVANLYLREQYLHDTVSGATITYLYNFCLLENEKKRLIDHLFFQLVKDEKQFVKKFYLNDKDIKQLSLDQFIGSHSRSHLPLAVCSSVKVDREIKNLIACLEKITNKKIQSISYPFGGFTAISPIVFKSCLKNGLTLGFTMNRDINNFSTSTDFFSLNRIDTNDGPGGKLKSLKFR